MGFVHNSVGINMVKTKKEFDLEDALTDVDYIPIAIRQENPIYEQILQHVMKSDKKATRVDTDKLNMKMKTVYYGLKARIKGTTYEPCLKLHIREGSLFVEKIEKK
jgi:hypothetical protein